MELKALLDFEFHSKVPDEIITEYEGKIPYGKIMGSVHF